MKQNDDKCLVFKVDAFIVINSELYAKSAKSNHRISMWYIIIKKYFIISRFRNHCIPKNLFCSIMHTDKTAVYLKLPGWFHVCYAVAIKVISPVTKCIVQLHIILLTPTHTHRQCTESDFAYALLDIPCFNALFLTSLLISFVQLKYRICLDESTLE